MYGIDIPNSKGGKLEKESYRLASALNFFFGVPEVYRAEKSNKFRSEVRMVKNILCEKIEQHINRIFTSRWSSSIPYPLMFLYISSLHLLCGNL
jgi:hypothetical protein